MGANADTKKELQAGHIRHRLHIRLGMASRPCVVDLNQKDRQMANGYEFKTWMVSEDGCGPTYYDTREDAEAFAKNTTAESPGYRVAIYQGVATVEAKVAKPKVFPWRAK